MDRPTNEVTYGHVHETNKAGYTALRCVLVLHFAVFGNFYKNVMDRPTDGPTDRWMDGPTLL